MSTTSSSSSSEESAERTDHGDNGDGGGGGGDGGFEGPSTSRSRRRYGSRVWPALFLEALSSQVAIDASRSVGRLAAALALANLFQVCSTWRAISSSDLLWQNLTRQVWRRDNLRRDNWREEFIFCHRTANNFRQQRYIYSTLPLPPQDPDNNNDNGSLYCYRLALSDHYLAAGFSNGAVHLFHLPNRLYVSTFYPQLRDRLGRFPTAITGIILSDTRIVFASLDGDIHVVVINQVNSLRLACLGDVVNDGALVDFAGCDQWWVGLYAGVPGRAFHVWNSVTEELVFVGGSLTDQEAVTGWHMLTDQLSDYIGRIRVTSHETAMACTRDRVMVFDLRNNGIILGEEEFQIGLTVSSVDASDESFLVVDVRGMASVRHVGTLRELCRFTVRGAAASRRVVLGCMNDIYGVICIGGVLRVWNIESGQYLYDFRERVGLVHAIIANGRCIAACSRNATIHLWDFGAE